MKHVVMFLTFAALAAPGFAPALAQDKPLCVDASHDGHYNAQPLSLHTVIARNAFGDDKRAAVLQTTCIHVDRSAFISLHSFSQCIAVGDDVVASIPGGPREICKVTKVTPTAQSYDDVKYSWN